MYSLRQHKNIYLHLVAKLDSLATITLYLPPIPSPSPPPPAQPTTNSTVEGTTKKEVTRCELISL